MDNMEFLLEIIYIGYLICLILDIWDVVIWVLFMFVVGNIDLFLEFIFVDIGIYIWGEIDSVLISVYLLSEIGFDKV